MIYTRFFIFLLLLLVAVFEFFPQIKYFRTIIPNEVYVDENCNCDCILKSRPWYSIINYWFYFFIFIVPVIIFSAKPNLSSQYKVIRTVLAIILGYIAINFAIHLNWDIRNAPFVVDSNLVWQKLWDTPQKQCVNIADGLSTVMMLYFGWIFGAIYAGIWLNIWYFYYKKQKTLTKNQFKTDKFNYFLAKFSYICVKYTLYIVILFPVAIGIYLLLAKYNFIPI